MKYNRIFIIVLDSLGVGEMPDAYQYGDSGSNTLQHIFESVGPIEFPNLIKLGINDFIKGEKKINHNNSYTCVLKEKSNGKDTMTGHWEIMGLNTIKPFQTFTEKGFPKSLVNELEEKTNYKFIGNYASSGTEILKVLGEEHIKSGSLILYTSSDSVLQIAAHEKIVPVDELYRICEIAREICLKPEYFVGRIIARPFLGEDKNTFYRVKEHRHDIAVSPFDLTVLDILKQNNIQTVAIGKIGDIFNQQGISCSLKSKNNSDGMDITINQLINNKNKGLFFTNLVEFDSEYGHRRNPHGYKKCLEEFDKKLGILLTHLRNDDLLILTADHGNDPTMKGSDHTREMVPFIAYSPLFKNGKYLLKRDSFSDIGDSVLFNFDLKKKDHMIGSYIKEVFDDL